MSRTAVAAIIALFAVAACTDAKTVVDPDATALEIVVEIPSGIGADRLQISTVTGEFAAGTVPDEPRPLAGEESVVVLLPESLDGQELIVRVDGLAGATVVGSGGARATVRAKSVERVVVQLGEPVVCGDGVVEPLLEPCDDLNTVASDGCSATCTIEPGFRCENPPDAPSACRPDTFDVVRVSSVGHRRIEVEFSDPPDPLLALQLQNYTVPGLTLSGMPLLVGNTVQIATTPQDPIGYNALVANVTRASDGKPLTAGVGAFTGRTAFSLMSARSSSATQIVLTFSDAPDPATAGVLANYAIAGLTLQGTPSIVGKDVTIATAVQVAIEYTVNVTNVRRAGDSEGLENGIASFSGVNGFDVTSAVSISNRKLVITFNAPPNAAAGVLNNYTVTGLTLVGTPVVNGATVSLDTSEQDQILYTVQVSNNVRRASDNQTLTINNTDFTGLPLMPPTVTAVEVLSTSPNNGTTFFNTGTAVVRLTGTQFATVMCPTGVKLDDEAGMQATGATSCTVDSDTQITAVFPAGIRTNGGAGFHVIVSNMVGSNATSDVLVTRAGLLISEVQFAGNAKEFVELYNPTANAINVTTIGLRLHTRNAMGTNSVKSLMTVRTSIPSHGFYLIGSSQSQMGDPWFGVIDATYNAMANGLGSNGAAYISLSNTAQSKVVDKLGWGSQPAGGFESNPIPDIPVGMSVERKPAGGAGHAVDTDTNANDFNAASTTLTPRGATSPPEG